MERNFHIVNVSRQDNPSSPRYTVNLEFKNGDAAYIDELQPSQLMDLSYIKVRVLRESDRVMLGISQGAWEIMLDNALTEMDE